MRAITKMLNRCPSTRCREFKCRWSPEQVSWRPSEQAGLDTGIPNIPGLDEIAAALIFIEIGDWIKQLNPNGRWPSPRPAAASA
jgi:hypothetical protein